jgi:hypothetical protein
LLAAFIMTRTAALGAHILLLLMATAVAAAADTIFLEAENFTQPSGSCWQPGEFGQNYYAATFHNTFLSRKAFLGAPDVLLTNTSCVATMQTMITNAGLYFPMVRYEMPYRFEAMFTLRVEQAGKVQFEGLYGQRDQAKVWGFKFCMPNGVPAGECRYAWGGTENHVWQGLNNRVSLAAGPATVSLIVDRTITPSNSAERHVDIVVLTQNMSDVELRLQHGGMRGNMPFDGWLTQEGDVFFRVVNNQTSVPMQLVVPFGIEHSSYWTHLRYPCLTDSKQPGKGVASCIPKVEITAAAGETTDWLEVGGMLDTLNDGEWLLKTVVPPKEDATKLSFTLEVGLLKQNVVAAESIYSQSKPDLEVIAQFVTTKCYVDVEKSAKGAYPKGSTVCGGLTLAYDANTRGSRRIRRVEEQLFDVMAEARLAHLPAHGAKPSLTTVTGHPFLHVAASSVPDPRYNQSVDEFLDMYTFVDPQTACQKSSPKCAQHKCYGSVGLEEYEKNANISALLMSIKAGYAKGTKTHFQDMECTGIITLGDEIGLPSPDAKTDQEAVDAAFIAWLHTVEHIGDNASAVGCESWAMCHWNISAGLSFSNKRLYYYSKSYSYSYGISYYANVTKAIQTVLPHAGIGANFSPNPDYVSESYKWIDCFRDDCLTMPW